MNLLIISQPLRASGQEQYLRKSDGRKGRACMEDSALGPQRKGRGSIRLPMEKRRLLQI